VLAVGAAAAGRGTVRRTRCHEHDNAVPCVGIMEAKVGRVEHDGGRAPTEHGQQTDADEHGDPTVNDPIIVTILILLIR